MSLRSRIDRLRAQTGSLSAPSTAIPSHGNPSMRSRLQQLGPERQRKPAAGAPRSVSAAALAAAVKGDLVADGLIRISESMPLTGRIGPLELDALKRINLLPGETRQTPGLYIDTETTGLAGGSGTLAFLVGFAHIEDQRIELRQFLITRFGAEPGLLSAIEQSVPAGHRLVSYNGKSYDLPLLATRFRIHAMSSSLSNREHLDLLHPVRRLFSRCWNDCRLTTLETRLLGFSREDDLPGSEAPEAWFSYLRSGDAQNLVRVIKHNRQDILSLALAHVTLAMAVTDPTRYQADVYGLARWLANVDESQALALLQQHRERLCDEGKRLLAHLLRRADNWTGAVPIWESLAEQGCMESIERLAKYHEHISKDLQAAWRYCERLPGSKADLHRRNRLREKLADEPRTGALKLVV